MSSTGGPPGLPELCVSISEHADPSVPTLHGCTPDWEAVDYNCNQPLSLPESEQSWPIRPDQRPEVVHTVEEFMDACLFQPHVDRVVVLSDGIRLMKQQNAIPAEVREAVSRATTMRSFLSGLSPDFKDKFKARLWQYSSKGKESEIRLKGGTKSIGDVSALLHEKVESGQVPENAPLYISELRWLTKVEHPIVKGESVKTATNCDAYDFTALSRKMPFWERSEGGIFIGERGAGSGLHVDQCLWSNIGKNWSGYKLFAVWPWSERHQILDDAGKGRMMDLPLTEESKAYIARARIVALIRPGDCYVFSGGQPHSALIIGDGINVSAYESIVPANPEAIHTLLRTNCGTDHWKKCWMDDEELDELYEDVVEAVQGALKDPGTAAKVRQRLETCVDVMRERGDAYMKKLWKKEDRKVLGLEKQSQASEGSTATSTRSRSRSRSRSGSIMSGSNRGAIEDVGSDPRNGLSVARKIILSTASNLSLSDLLSGCTSTTDPMGICESAHQC